MQIGVLSTPCGAANAHLLQQLELQMLLGMLMYQLTASIPASYPRAQEVQAAAHPSQEHPLSTLFAKADLHSSLHRPPAGTAGDMCRML
jgi:hypothetical protein